MDSIQKSIVTLTGNPITEHTGNIFLHAPVITPDSGEERYLGESESYIKVDRNTEFTFKAQPKLRRRYAGSVIVLLTIVGLIVTLYIFQYLESPSTPYLSTTSTTLLKQYDDTVINNYKSERHMNGTTDITPITASNMFTSRTEYAATANEIIDPGTIPETSKYAYKEEILLSNRYQEPDIERNASVPIPDVHKPYTAQKKPIQVQSSDTEPYDVNSNEHNLSGGEKILKISHRKPSEQYDEQIDAANSAYMSGNYLDAKQAYMHILDKIPNHHDALLGAATMAQVMNEPEEAKQGYMKVLANYPGDPEAITGLINLMDSTSVVENIIVITRLLQEHTNDAYLYFSLGNLQAIAHRWPDAQQAFAGALQLDEDNPDYNYNLAVSLDHLGHITDALHYYQTALELIHGRNPHFDNTAVKARIAVLSEKLSGQ